VDLEAVVISAPASALAALRRGLVAGEGRREGCQERRVEAPEPLDAVASSRPHGDPVE
jgi:hypothetical protein